MERCIYKEQLMQVKPYITLGMPALASPAELFLKLHLNTAHLFKQSTI